MENKKTKLTISGTSKKSIKNIEKAKTQSKNSDLIEKNRNNFLKKGSFNKTSSTGFKSKSSKSILNKGFQAKPIFSGKTPSSSNDFERRKLAEQRATKRLKGDQEGKKSRQDNKKRELKLTVSRALSDEIEAKERSLASVRRAREKENKNWIKKKRA